STTFQLEFVPNDSWGEYTLNWNNKPAGSTVLATWTGETSGLARRIDITSIVQQQLATDPSKLLSLHIVSTTLNTATNWVYYAAREDSTASNWPQLITVAGTSNQAPTVATPATAAPSSVADTTTSLSVLGADDGGEANLTYTWSLLSGPAAVSFSAN